MDSKISVLVAFGDHLVKGSLNTRGQRYLDLLNSPERFVELEDAELFRLQAHQAIAKLPQVAIPKQEIIFGIPLVADHEAPVRRVHSHSEKDVYESLVIAGHFELRGNIHIPRLVDEKDFLVSTSTFFPMTNATIASSLDEAIEATVALVQTRFVSLLHITPPECQAESLSAKIRELLMSGDDS